MRAYLLIVSFFCYILFRGKVLPIFFDDLVTKNLRSGCVAVFEWFRSGTMLSINQNKLPAELTWLVGVITNAKLMVDKRSS